MPSPISLAAGCLVAFAFWAAFRWYCRQLSGAAHYKRYPAAKLLDEGIKQGFIHRDNIDDVVDRLGNASTFEHGNSRPNTDHQRRQA